ncbi:hypothetical protein [Vibrio sp. WXL103]|uniref:hypothetical protein n=1 Tax=Vibrio sp. WXL103 TaxID=3450710 RepID=UPI003EC6CEC8
MRHYYWLIGLSGFIAVSLFFTYRPQPEWKGVSLEQPQTENYSDTVDSQKPIPSHEVADFNLEHQVTPIEPEREQLISVSQPVEFGNDIIFAKQAKLEADKAAASELLLIDDYQRYLEQTYSEANIIEFYQPHVPEVVLLALLDLRHALDAHGKRDYLYSLPHAATYQLLAEELMLQYQYHQSYGTGQSPEQMLAQAQQNLELVYGDELATVINWFGIENLPKYSQLLILRPSESVYGGSDDNFVTFSQVIDQLFPDYAISYEDLKSVRPINSYIDIPN